MRSWTRLPRTFAPVILGTAAMAAGCSGSGSADAGTACTTQALEVYFSPMYSAYADIPDHKFQIPAIVSGVDQSDVTWSASDNSLVSLTPDPSTGGTMITVLGPGTVTITAQVGDICGSSVLTIDSSTEAQWELGSNRYNNGEPDGGAKSDAGGFRGIPNTVMCTFCHGPTATGPFVDVAHTPEQTGGFSDDDLESIVRHGTVPDGGYFDPTIVAYAEWQHFHQWDMTDDEFTGIVVYLRSLTPAPQNGTSNFGGHGPPPDGGFRQLGDGGFSRPDAGHADAG